MVPKATLLVIVVVMVLGASFKAMAWPPWKQHMSVNIINHVVEDGVRETPIFVDCKSGNGDQKQRTVMPNQTYGFGFYPDVFGSTKFWCTFQWVRPQGNASQSFVVWKDIGLFPGENSRKRPCDQCVYIVHGEEGFYRSEGEDGPFTHIFDWIYPL